LEDLRRRDKVSLEELWELMDRQITRGRRGIRMYRKLVVERTPGNAPTHSDLEDLFLRLVRDFDLSVPTNQWEVTLPNLGVVHFDFGYPGARLAIELDSYAWHDNDPAFENDRLRDMDAQLLGIRVLRFTWSMLKWRREYVADMIRSHLQLSSGSLVAQ
jgi:hypothetical protein